MLSPPSYSPVKHSANPPSTPHGLAGTPSPSKIKRSPIAPLWSRSPQGHTHAPSTHVTHASSSARRGLFSGSGDEGMEGVGRAGAGTPVNHRWPAHQYNQGMPPSPAQAARGSRAGSASAASSADTSPTTTAAAAAAAASATEWGVQGANSMDSAHSSCGGAEEGGSRGPPPFNLSGIASSAQHAAAAVLRAGAGALLPGSNTSGEGGESHAQQKLSSELARRTARSLSSSPDGTLGLDHPGEGHIQWADRTEHPGSSASEGAGGLRDAEENQLGGVGMLQGIGSAQASARRAQLLVAYLEGEDNSKVQGALLLLLDHLTTRKLSPADLIDAGAVPLLASLIASHCTDPAAPASHTSPAALTSSSALTSPAALKSPAALASPAAAAATATAPDGNRLLPGSGGDALEKASTALAALEVANALVAAPALVPAEAKGALVPLVGPVLEILGANAARLASQDTDLEGAGLMESGREEPEWPRLPITFFAGNIVVRLSVFDQPAAALVRGEAISILTANLAALPTVLPQVCVFALYKLLQVGSNADNLSVLLQGGGAHGLVTFMGSSGNKKGDPAACELAATILLSLALLPEAPQSAADTNLVAPLVKLLGPSSPSPAVRMYALLILGRLASRCSAMQMDLAREGAIPFLVSLMKPKAKEEEQLHAARLTAILAQATPTHQMLQSHDVMEALLGLLQSSKPAVVEHAASVFSVLANNPATHFQVVGWGAVPLLVRLLQPPPSHPSIGFNASHAEDGSSVDAILVDNEHSPKAQTFLASRAQTDGHSPKAQTYALATLLLLAMHETRHADVICRSGAIPNLVRLVKEGGSSSVQEYAAAVLACMAHAVDVQMDIITSGGIPALVGLLDKGGPEAQASAAEVLVTLSAVDHHRKRLITRASEILSSLLRLLESESASSRYWGATLLHMLCHDDAVLLEVLGMDGVLAALVGILKDTSPNEEPEARLAQVQSAWLIARLCESAEASTALAGMDAATPLVSLVAAGMVSQRQGLGGGVHYSNLGMALPHNPFYDPPSTVLPRVRRRSDGGGESAQVSSPGTGVDVQGSGIGSYVADPSVFQAGGDFGITSLTQADGSREGGVDGEDRVTVHFQGKERPVSGSMSSGSGSTASGSRSSKEGQGGAGLGGAGGSSFVSSSSGKGGGSKSQARKRPLRIEPLDSNAHAAGVAALLALARSSSDGRDAVEGALAFQEAWAGGTAPRVVLAALSAPAIS